jgi:hypothetical protein
VLVPVTENIALAVAASTLVAAAGVTVRPATARASRHELVG